MKTNIHWVMLLFVMGMVIVLSGCRTDPCLEDIPLYPELPLDPPIGQTYDIGYAEPGLVTFSWQAEPLRCYSDYYALTVWRSDNNEPEQDDAVLVTTRENSIEYPVPLAPISRYKYRLTQYRSTERMVDVGRVTEGRIYTGPLCSEQAQLEPVHLIAPADHQIYSVFERLRFEDPNNCYIGTYGYYNIRIEADPEFENELNRPTTDPEYEEVIYDTISDRNRADGFDVGYPLEWCVPYYWRVTTMIDGVPPLISDVAEFIYIKGGALEPVTLLSPADHAVISEEELVFDWQEPSDCESHFMYEIQVSEHQNFSPLVYQMPYNILDPITMERPRPQLETCTQYYWRIMTDPPGSLPAMYSEVRSFVLSDPAGPCPIVIPQLTPFTLEVLTTSTPTPEPAPPTVTALINLNCRSGPGSVYDIDDTLLKGESAPVDGRNAESTWWHILIADHKKYCWVWAEKATFNGDPDQIPILAAPSTPTPTEEEAPPAPVDCTAFGNQASCEANSACKWETGVTRKPFCTDK